MKKYIQNLLFLAVLLMPWTTQAQSLERYGFSTGTDPNKWIVLTAPTQILTPTGIRALASSVQSIGFTFPFGASTYTQYSVNTDGNLRLGPAATGTANYNTPFSANNANYNNPKINAFGCSGYGVDRIHYVKEQLIDDSLLVVEFCIGANNNDTRNTLYKWQIHLYSNGNIDIVFPDEMPIAPGMTHQCGLCTSSSDGWIIQSGTHSAEYFTSGTTLTNASDTWFDANRYYSFIHPDNLSCARPIRIMASNTTTHNAILSWTSGGSETAWELTVGDSVYYTTDTFYTVNNLDSNTQYNVRVRAICGVGDTSLVSSASFRTASLLINTLPYFNGFENEPHYIIRVTSYVEAFPYGWTRLVTPPSATHNYPYIDSTSSLDIHGHKAMAWHFNNNDITNLYAVLPPIELDSFDISDLTLSFFAKSNNREAPFPQFIVGVMTNHTDTATFVPVDTVTVAPVSLAMYVVNFANYNGTGNYIAIRYPRPTSSRDVVFDDLFLTDHWCDPPTHLVASSSNSDVTLRWNGNGNSSFTVILGADTITGVTDTFYTFYNLHDTTVYHYAVAAECGNSNSMFVVGSIQTECVPFTLRDLPYFEDFEAYGTDRTAPISPCWHRGMTVLSGIVNTDNSPYLIRFNLNGDTAGLSFSGVLTSANYYGWVALPRLANTIDISLLELTFMVQRTNSASTLTQVVVGVASDLTTDTTFVPVDTVDLSNEPVSSLHSVSVRFANYTGNGRYIVINAAPPMDDGSAWISNGFYLDNVTLMVANPCPTPQHVSVTRTTATGANVTWDGDTTANGWLVYVGTPGFSIDSVSPIYVYDTTANIGNLNSNTEYEVVVVADCSDTVSRTSYPAQFRTLCAPLRQLPFIEDFEGTTGYTYTSAFVNNLPTCWMYYNTGTQYSYHGYPIVINDPSSAHSGNNTLLFHTSTASGGQSGEFTPQFAIMPITDSSRYPLSDLQITFWTRNHTSAPSTIVVGVMSDPYDTSTFIPVRTVTCNASMYSERHTVGFANYAGLHGHVAFKAPFGNYNANNPSIDDITLEVIPIACATITAIHTEATASAAHLTWEYNIEFGTPSGFDVSYRHADDTNGTVINIFTTDPEVLLTGLDADTDYWVAVSAFCGGLNGTADTILFRTQALPCAELDTANIPEDTLTLGNPGTGTNAMFPVSATAPSSRVQHLFLASEIPVSGPTTLKGIGFDYAYNMPAGYASNCTIYLAHTTRDSMTNSFDGSPQQMVFTGSLAFCEPGWNYVLFNQGFFEYDGVSNLCVTIEKNSGYTANSNYTFRHETTVRPMTLGAGRPRPVGAWTISTVGRNMRSNTRLITSGDVYCGRWESCLPPVVHLDTITEDDYRLWWIPGYQEPSWDVDYRQADSTVWTNAISATHNTHYTFSTSALGLEPNVRYEFRVKANCSDSTDTAASVFLITPCAYMDIPFSYGFEGLPTGSTTVPLDIHCWYHLNDAPVYNGLPFIHSLGAHTGNRGLIFSPTVSQTNYGSYQGIVLPRVDTAANPIHTLHLSFWARPGGNYDDPVLYVGVMTDPTDITTFQYVDTIEIDNTTTDWQLYEANFDGYTGNGEYLAIRANRPETGSWSAYIDDINVSGEGLCHRVRDIVVRDITPNSATISWSPGGSEREWELTVGYNIYHLMDTFYTVNILNYNTPYDVSVRAICGEGDTSIPWTSFFRTPCFFLSNLPYFNDLESEPYYHVPVVYRPDAFPLCWVRLIDPPNATNYYPHIVNGYNLYRIHGNNSLYWAINYSNAHNQYALLPPVDLSVYDMRDLTLAFYAKKISNTDAPYLQFIVGVMDNNTDSSTFVPVDTVTPTLATTLYRVDFSNYTGTGNYIAIRCPRTTYSREAVIDDIFLTDHWCELPTHLHAASTDTSVTVHWDGNGDSSFTVILGTDTVTGLTDTFYTFTGLRDSTLYYYSVAGECSGRLGMFVTDSIQTECRPLTLRDLPYFEDFEAYGPGTDISTCWHKGVTFTSGIPYLLDQPRLNTIRIGADTVGLTLQGYNSDVSSYYTWVALPRLEDTLDVSRLEVDFLMVRPETTTQPLIQLVVGISTDQAMSGDINTASSFVPVDTIDLTNEPLGSLHSVAVRFENYTGNGKYVVFMAPVPPADSAATHYTIYNSFGIDNITLRVANPCPTPQHVRVTRTTADSVYVTWAGDSTADAWRVYIGRTGTDISTFTPHQVTDTAVVIGNLNPDTDYELVIAAVCNGNESFTTYPVRFHTLCAPLGMMPIVEDFESTTGYTYPHASVNNLPHCWLYHNTGTEFSYRSFPIVLSDASYAHGGSNAMGFATANSPGPYADQIAIMPLTDSILYPVSTLQVSFWMRSYHYYYQSFIVVGVMSDYADSSTFVPVDTFYTHASTTYAHHTARFFHYTGPHGHVAFKAPMSSISSNQPYIDDIVLEVLCPGVENLHVNHSAFDTLTIAWAGSGTAYEVAIKAVADTAWPAAVAVTDTTYTFTGLQPETTYQFRVRQDCSSDTFGHSRWMSGSFTTNRRPCYAPDSLTVSDITNSAATFAWRPGGIETAWEIHVWNTAFDTFYAVVSYPATVGGFTAAVTYYAAVRALCGTDQSIEGFWSDTLQFSAAICANVTNLTASHLTFNSVTLTWDAVPGAQGYRVVTTSGQYSDTVPLVTTNRYIYTGLLPETQYHFYIQTICGDDWYAETWANVIATTPERPDDAGELTINVNDASMGYVTINGIETTAYTGHLGDVVSLAAVPYEGFLFLDWSDGETESTRNYTLTEAFNTLTATFAPADGIAEPSSLHPQLSILPNPAKGATTVSVSGIIGKVHLSILDLRGRELLSKTLECSADCEKALDLKGLMQGAYFVRVISENVTPIVKKLIVR